MRRDKAKQQAIVAIEKIVQGAKMLAAVEQAYPKRKRGTPRKRTLLLGGRADE